MEHLHSTSSRQKLTCLMGSGVVKLGDMTMHYVAHDKAVHTRAQYCIPEAGVLLTRLEKKLECETRILLALNTRCFIAD